MKRLLFIFIVASLAIQMNAEEYSRRFLITGASFAVPENGWFELVCEAFNAQAINRAVESEAIMQTAVKMYNGTLYSQDELEQIDAFIILHVHNQNVANTEWIKEDYTEYTLSTLSANYSVAYDYVIKKYQDDCRRLKDNPASSYYGSENGKPAVIFLCTHWHDSRTVYNPAIRTLAQRWNLPLIKWDENIGFSKNQPDTDGKQPSIQYARDNENIGGVTYGWHPLRGKGQYIQQKMAGIAMAELEKIFGELPVSTTVNNKSILIKEGEKAEVSFTFTGVPPWNLTYSVNNETHSLENIEENPVFVEIDLPPDGSAVVCPEQVSNRSAAGTVAGEAVIARANKWISPLFDTYAHQAFPSTKYDTEQLFQLKLAGTHGRESFLSFNTGQLSETDSRIIFRAYFYEIIYPNNKKIKEPHQVEIAGSETSYSSITWNSRPNTGLTPIDTVAVQYAELESYTSWDVTDWVKAQIADGKTTLTFRLRIISTGSGLLNFYSSESTQGYPPQIAASENTITRRENIQWNSPAVETSVYTLDGRKLSASNTQTLPHGVYLQQLRSGNQTKTHKIIK
jgi:hypothetical protein